MIAPEERAHIDPDFCNIIHQFLYARWVIDHRVVEYL